MSIRHGKPVSVLIMLLGCLLVTGTVHAQKVQVNSADPAEGEQTKTLVVTINGNGFGNPSKVKFLLSSNGNPGDVSVVGDPQFVSSKRLKVMISISDDFDPQDYDIEVENLATGRRGKGHTMFKVLKKGGGNVDPTFDVTYTPDDVTDPPRSPVKFSGLNWRQKTSSTGISYWRSDPKNGEGWINLDYFRDADGPFADRGVKCFAIGIGDVEFDYYWWTHIEGVQLWEDNNSGIAILNMNFIGTTAEEDVTLQYHLHLEGFFDPEKEFPPLYLTTVTMTTWKLQLTAKKLRKKYSDKSCVGEGDFETDIWVERN